MSFLRGSARLLLSTQNLAKSISIDPKRHVKRWVAPTLRELRRRKEKMGIQPSTVRSSYVEWNYHAEIYAFGKRLNEEFDRNKLQQAFVNRSYIIQEELRLEKLGIENPSLDMQDNRELIEKGERLIKEYVNGFLKFSLPKVPISGIIAIEKWLTAENQLALISSNIGIGDLVLCSEHPVSNSTLADTFKALIGSLASSSGDEKAYKFIRDFICTHLNQKDLTECWIIEDPLKMLTDICKERKLAQPESRMLGETGRNTVLGSYYTGLYLEKKLIGKGFGDSIDNAIQMAALDALRDMFGIQEHIKSFNYNVELDKITNKSVSQKNNVKIA